MLTFPFLREFRKSWWEPEAVHNHFLSCFPSGRSPDFLAFLAAGIPLLPPLFPPTFFVPSVFHRVPCKRFPKSPGGRRPPDTRGPAYFPPPPAPSYTINKAKRPLGLAFPSFSLILRCSFLPYLQNASRYRFCFPFIRPYEIRPGFFPLSSTSVFFFVFNLLPLALFRTNIDPSWVLVACFVLGLMLVLSCIGPFQRHMTCRIAAARFPLSSLVIAPLWGQITYPLPLPIEIPLFSILSGISQRLHSLFFSMQLRFQVPFFHAFSLFFRTSPLIPSFSPFPLAGSLSATLFRLSSLLFSNLPRLLNPHPLFPPPFFPLLLVIPRGFAMARPGMFRFP